MDGKNSSSEISGAPPCSMSRNIVPDVDTNTPSKMLWSNKNEKLSFEGLYNVEMVCFLVDI